MFIGALALVLLITAQMSEDKKSGIIGQLWKTYFGGDRDMDFADRENRWQATQRTSKIDDTQDLFPDLTKEDDTK